METPKLDPRILESSRRMAEQKKKERQKASVKAWLLDKSIDILALIVAVIALLRTF